MKILIIEDDVFQLNALKKIVSEYKTDSTVLTASTFADATSLYMSTDIDLFFIDIELEKGATDNGLVLAQNIRNFSSYENTPIIFVTAYKEQIFKAVNSVHCFNYITKPYKCSDILDAMNDVEHKVLHSNDRLTIRDARGVYYNIKYNSIIYIENASHNAILHTANGNFKYMNHSLESLLTILDVRFIRIHKKYVINIDYLINYDKTCKYVLLNNPMSASPILSDEMPADSTHDTLIYNHSVQSHCQLPIGRAYKRLFEERFLK